MADLNHFSFSRATQWLMMRVTTRNVIMFVSIIAVILLGTYVQARHELRSPRREVHEQPPPSREVHEQPSPSAEVHEPPSPSPSMEVHEPPSPSAEVHEPPSPSTMVNSSKGGFEYVVDKQVFRLSEDLSTAIETLMKKIEGLENISIEKRFDDIGKQLKETNDKLQTEGLQNKLDKREKLFSDVNTRQPPLKQDMENLASNLTKVSDDIKEIRGIMCELSSNLTKMSEQITEFTTQLIQEEIQKFAADGIGRVDYALATGGTNAKVVRHSKPYKAEWKEEWFVVVGAHPLANNMLKPSFGEPGQCFPLAGSSGFVQIKLATAIIPEAFTLEHVAKTVAYNRSRAPKDCKVYGLVRNPDSDDEKEILLAAFTYDLEKSNVQTFNVAPPYTGHISTVRFEFMSNHGSRTHTCLYRFRVHGRYPFRL